MTIQEIEKDLPFGFHDAIVENMNLNFAKKIAQIDLKLCVPDSNKDKLDKKEEYKKGNLRFIDFLFFTIEPPYEKNYFKNNFAIDLVTEDISYTTDVLNKLYENLPEGYAVICFSLLNHNTFMYFIAKGVEFEWLEKQKP